MQPKFLYFDLGKVLVDFSYDQMLAQVGAAAGIEAGSGPGGHFRRRSVAAFRGRPALLGRVLRGLLRGHRQPARFRGPGRGGQRDFFPQFAGAAHRGAAPTGRLPHGHPLEHLRVALGLLRAQYRIVSEAFAVHSLSFRIGAVKPEAGMFHAAAELAGVRPEEIFYVDDMPQHVAGRGRWVSTPCSSPRPRPWRPSSPPRPALELLRARLKNLACRRHRLRTASLAALPRRSAARRDGRRSPGPARTAPAHRPRPRGRPGSAATRRSAP